MAQCRLPTRADLRRLYNHFLAADGDPGIPYIDTEFIGQGLDVTQDGWLATDNQELLSVNNDVSSPLDLTVIAPDRQWCHVIDYLFLDTTIAGTGLTMSFRVTAPGGATTVYGIVRQDAIGDTWYFNAFTSQTQAAATVFPSRLPVQYLPPGYRFNILTGGGVATQLMTVICQYRRAPSGAKIATYV